MAKNFEINQEIEYTPGNDEWKTGTIRSKRTFKLSDKKKRTAYLIDTGIKDSDDPTQTELFEADESLVRVKE